MYKDHHGWWLVIAIENTPLLGEPSAGLAYHLSDLSTLALSYSSLRTEPIIIITSAEAHIIPTEVNVILFS